MKHTKEPWAECGCGKCLTINGGGRPIITVESGKIGDSYPSIRLIGPSMDRKAEAYTEFIAYDEIPKDEATANAQRIVACVNACEGMENPVEEINNLRHARLTPH